MKSKRLLLALLMALVVPWAATAQQTVQIGEGTATSNQVPIGTYYNYSITEQLYTAEEIGMAGTISSLSFYYMGIAAKEFPITVYMMNTNATNLSTGISLAGANEVFNGTLSVTATAGWVTMELDTPFEYDGTSNLLIGVNKGNTQWYNGQTWQGTTTASAMARYTENDGSAYNTSTVPGTAMNTRPNIRLEITAGGGGMTCDRPESLTAVASDNPSYPSTNAILLQWQGGSGIYNVQIKKASQSADEWATKAAYFTDNALLIGNLDAGTAYNARVQSVCYDNEGGDPELPDLPDRDEITSSWRNVDFTTDMCLPEDQCQITLELHDSYGDGWNGNAIKVVDVRTNSVLGQFTISSGSDATHTLTVCDGSTIQFVWVSGSYPDETSYVVTDAFGDEIFSGSNAMSAPVNYTVNCTPPTCPKPLGVTASDVTAHEATITWTSDASAWEIQLNEDEPIAVTETTYTLSRLTPETSYSVKVRANCNGDYSDWTNPVSFTTGIACPVPTALGVALTPGNGSVATLSWTSDASAWVVAYKTASDTDFTEVNVTENPYTLTNLRPETAYTATVKAVCGGEDGASQWTYPITFTPTDAYQITVNDGTSTNNYVPIYGNWVDNITKSQFIVPANALTDMVYGTINRMTFYASQANVSWGSAQFEVYVAETNETTISALADYGTMNKVKNAGSLSISGNQMVIEFDAPYQYMGGNLMVGFLQTASGNYVSCSWYGVTATGASMGGYGTSISQRNFLPKTTFDYVPGEAPACPKPLGVTASDVTAHEATITWTSDAAVWEIQLNDEDAITVNEPTYTFIGLVPETAYTVKVRTICGDAYSDWSNPLSFTTGIACPVPTQISVSDITPYTATVNWFGQAESFNLMLDTVVIENVTSPFELTNLYPETTYTVKVKALCGGDDGASQWSNGISFTTGEICPDGMVCIGAGTATSTYMPVNNYYNYSLSEQIFTAAEIGQAGTITSIEFYKAATTAAEKILNIYMVATDKDEFSGTTDWIAVTASDLVYSGTVNFVSNAWTTIELDSPFTYDGSSNICIVVDNNTGNYVSNTAFRSFNDVKNRTLYYQSDSTNPDPFDPTITANGRTATKNRIRMAIGEPPACPKPTAVAVDFVGGNTAIVTWAGQAEAFNMDVNGEVYEGVTSPYTLQGLELATTYNVSMQAICDAEHYSDWTTPVSFTTDLCMPDNQCAITFELTDSYGDGWNGAYIEVVDVLTGKVLGSFTNENADAGEAKIFTLGVCDGRDITFVWHNGSYDSECSFVIKDLNNEVIVEGVASSLPFTYTVSCTVACPTFISGFEATNITTHQAMLSWNGEYESYQVRYMSVNDTDWSEPIETNANALVITDLEADTYYDYQVRGYCQDLDDYSSWVDGIFFQTASICSAPMNLMVIPSIETARLSWTGYQESYTVTWGNNDDYYVAYNIYGNTTNLYGLQPSTTYTATVRGEGDCGEFEDAQIEFTTGTGWEDPNIWTGPNSINLEGGVIAVIQPGEEPTTIPEDITIGDGSYIVIEPGAEVLYSGQIAIPVVFTFDDEEEDEPGPRCREEQNNSGYKLIAPPVFRSATEPYMLVPETHLMDMPDAFYNNDLYGFDVTQHAQEWRNYKADQDNFKLYWKHGYLYYGPTNGTWQGLMVANTNNSETVNLVYDETNVYMPGANLLGNPFTSKGYPNMPFYVLNSQGNEVVLSTRSYVSAGRGFFVLATGTGQSCTISTEDPNAAIVLNISLYQDCSKIDAAAINFSDAKTLDKFQLNPNHTKIYMPFEGKDYAVVQGEEIGETPINFETTESGTYTLSFSNREVEFSYLRLIDNKTGVETNLLETPEYTFDAQSTDYASRFRLLYATGSSSNGNSFGFFNGMGNFTIFGIEGEATLQVVDVTGRILSSETFSGSYERKLSYAPGVYMLRLINGNDVKVQKVVVR